MPETRLITDCWTGSTSVDDEVASPSLTDVLQAVRRLDGKKYTSVSLTYAVRREMIVSGGNEGRYVVNIMVDVDEEFYNLENGQPASGRELNVMTGGQLGSFSEHNVVDLATAMKAATHFLQTGRPDGQLTWEHQS